MTDVKDPTIQSVGEGLPDKPIRPDGSSDGRARGMTFETLAVVGFIFGVFAIAAAVFAIGLSARAVEVSGRNQGSGGGEAAASTGGPKSVDVSMKEFAFDPKDIKVAADGKLLLSNTGAMAHDLAIGDLASEMIDPGSKGELDLKGLAPGSYTFICQVAGHEAAGMKGTITVG